MNPILLDTNGRLTDSTVNAARRRLIQSALALGGALLLGFDPRKTIAFFHIPGVLPMSPASHAVERIEFISAGETIVGLLCLPTGGAPKWPGVVLLGPFGFIKEQSPAEYALRLANAGFAALIFDPRGSGESGGTPRRYESPAGKIVDTLAAINYLSSRPEVDADRLAVLGICQGCSEMIAVAAAEPRIKALALVSGQYLYAENLAKFFSGGGPSLNQRIERGREAKACYESSGAVDYTKVVDLTDKSAGLPWPAIHDWYMPWTSEKWGKPSRWENRYATMSDAEIWTFDVEAHARKLRTPTLVLHGEMSDGGSEAAQHVYALMPTKQKKLHIVPGVFHTRFYDDPMIIEPAAAEVVAWFAVHLA